ncbi:MAG: tetratricopeptide repeat protein [Desulfosalsimonas sp.]
MTQCSMHPARTAQWQCLECGLNLCSDCVIRQEAGHMSGARLLRSCPKCLRDTRWIGAKEIIKPFWERIPGFFVYPLSPGTLLYMAILAAGAFLYWSWIIQFLCWVLLLNYAYVSLRNTASGDLNPPQVSEMLSGNFLDVVIPVVKQAVLIFVLIVVGVFLTGRLGVFAGLLYMLLAVFLLPSMIIVLVNTESLITALNPAAFLALPFKIGRGYFIMFVFLALLALAPGALLQWVMPYLPPLLGLYLMSLAQNYYTLVSYHLMGYVLLQYHESIGYEIEADDIRGASAEDRKVPDDPASREKKATAVLLSEGRFDEAADHIRQWREQGGDFDAGLAEQYFELLKAGGDKQGMVEHAPVYLDFAVAEGKKKQALEAYDACRQIDSDFSVGPQVLFRLGEWMSESGRFRDALKTFSGLVKADPDADEAPLSYFRAAQLYHDRFMDTEKAIKILKTLIRRYPDHEMRTRFENYLEYIGGA